MGVAAKADLYSLTLLTASDAGQRMNPPVSATRIVQLEREGRIRAIRASNGTRLFLEEDVTTLARQRMERR